MNTSSDDTGGFENAELEDLATLLAKVADQLAELSVADEVPSGFKKVSGSFEPPDVDFTSSGWLLKVLQVQAWLNPDDEIDLQNIENEPAAAAQKLFAAIGSMDSQACVHLTNGVVSLTLGGAEYLASRLDSAIQFQRDYSEKRESHTKKQATEEWLQTWDELDTEPPTLEPIRATSATWGINDFWVKARKGLLNLSPSYQRGDVWPTRDAQKLIESILRGIPLPSIILLRPAGKAAQTPYEVVDGKQRLTAILRFMGKHPKALERVKLMSERFPDAKLSELFNEDYKKFRRAWKNVLGESLTDKKEAEYYFPFRLASSSDALQGPLAATAGKYYCEIAEEHIDVSEGQESVEEVFETSSAYKIPLIEYLEATPKQIHEVFHLYNRQGKHLNAEEIRNALFHEVDLMKLVLVAAGDNANARTLAPYVPEDNFELLRNIAKCLAEYRFGTARYKRTKLLSWLFALLFEPAVIEGDLRIRSTAKHIDALFERIETEVESGRGHKLSKHDVLVNLIRDTDRCLEAHSSADCWSPKFQNDDRGQSWQELQLVASLVGVFLVGTLGESASELLAKHRTRIREFTASRLRPVKTQNRTQWEFIGEVSLGIVQAVGVNEEELEKALVSTYGVSCVPTLRAAKALFELSKSS